MNKSLTQTDVKVNKGISYEINNTTNINLQVTLNSKKDVDLIADLISKLDAKNLHVNPTFKYVQTIDMFVNH